MTTDVPVPRAAAAFSADERDRLAALLVQYRELVRRSAAGETLANEQEQAVVSTLESLWLVEGCWRRDVAAWREMAAVRARLAKLRATATAEDYVKSSLAGLAELKASGGRRMFATADSTLFKLRHREQELEVVHPHLFSSVEVAAFLRWDCARRVLRWSNVRD